MGKFPPFFVVVEIKWAESGTKQMVTIKVVSTNPAHDEVYSIQLYVIKFVSDLWQVVGFLCVFRFPPRIKLTATISLTYC